MAPATCYQRNPGTRHPPSARASIWIACDQHEVDNGPPALLARSREIEARSNFVKLCQ